MNPRPLMIMTDAPTARTGLGRIGGDLARNIAEHLSDIFRVCTFGYGGVVSRHLPYHQYIMEGAKDFIAPTLPEVWRDWAGDEKGVLLTIWDLSRLGWLLRPDLQCENAILREFLLRKPFKIWTYLPIDAEGPQNKLTFPLKEILKGSDRVLAYGKWGAGVVDRTMGLKDGTTEWLPHGIDSSVFYPRDRKHCRAFFPTISESFTITGAAVKPVGNHEVLVGIVCTNQSRKDFPLAIEAFSKIRNVPKRLWIKTDVAERHWSIPALLLDYGIEHNTYITLSELSDEQMAQAYSASDITLAPGAEGFGFPIVESLACGTPVITGNYAGGAELVTPHMRIDHVAFRYESIWSYKRPVYNPMDWAVRAETWIGQRVTMDRKYDWKELWPHWESWFREGLK